MKPIILAATAALAFAAGTAQAADTLYPNAPARIALTGAGYTQNFDTLATTGTSAALPAGWQVFEGGTNGNATYAADDGGSNAGNVYSYGTGTSTERALGSLGSGSLSPIYYGALFSNATGGRITGLDIGYTGEQWRAGSATDLLTFQYSLDATAINAGTWTTFSALNFTGPNTGTAGAIDGNAAANRTVLFATLANLGIAAGSNFAIRWFDEDTTGSDDGLAIDNVSVRALTAVSPVPEPATWAMMLVGFAMVGGVARYRRRQLSRVIA